MPQVIKLKRSAVESNIPTTAQLELGEIAINTFDGKMFIKKDDGVTETIVEIGSGGSTTSEVETFVSPTDFTAGTTDELTLSETPTSIKDVMVFFNGVYVHHTELASLVGPVLTFVDPITVGTTIIDVRYSY